MEEKIVEPSEILIDGDGTVKSAPKFSNPWLRFLGRLFDYSLLLWVLLAVRLCLPHLFRFWRFESFVPYEYLLWIPIESTCLWAFGKTPGKWFLKIDLRQGKNSKLNYTTAIRRSFLVWLRGFGAGVPFINAICMLVAYHRLKVFRSTSWDRDEHIQIEHRPIAAWRIWCSAIIAIAGFVAYGRV